MHDIKTVRDDPGAFDRALTLRGLPPQSASLLAVDHDLRAAKTRFQTAQARRNEISKQVGQAKTRGDEALATRLLAEIETIKHDLSRESAAEAHLQAELDARLAALPNLPSPETPPGASESDNVEVRRWGAPFASAAPRDHVDLGEALGLMDFDAAVRMSGSRFVVLKGELARLERALGQFMIDMHTQEHGYTEVAPPLLVRGTTLFGTGQLPKFADDLFHTEDDRWLIPTAEVSLTNLVREQITPAESLPLRFSALTPCFRAEAGASGRDTRGMIRQHQFAKVELVSIVEPEQARAEHERMTACAEAVLKRLELPFRTVLLCAGDMGFTARRTYDLEVWLPSQNTFREISSCSDCGDFQARRMEARTKSAGEKGARYVHTLNGSGVAVGRALVAVMENYQDEGGRIAIPQALHPYLRGLSHVGSAP
jgi:seryl-tRNA synthetase